MSFPTLPAEMSGFPVSLLSGRSVTRQNVDNHLQNLTLRPSRISAASIRWLSRFRGLLKETDLRVIFPSGPNNPDSAAPAAAGIYTIMGRTGLPVEKVDHVLEHMTLSSLPTLRTVNTPAYLAMKGKGYFQLVANNAEPAIRATVDRELGDQFTIKDLFDVLHTQDYAECGNFGGFLYLLTFERACLACLKTAERFHPRTPAHARDACAITDPALRAELTRLPTAKVRRGRYGCDGRAKLI